jgi:hypothetical protein
MMSNLLFEEERKNRWLKFLVQIIINHRGMKQGKSLALEYGNAQCPELV